MNTQLLNPLYWLSLQPAVVDGLFGKVLFGIFLIFLLLGVVCRIFIEQRSKDRYLVVAGRRLISMFVTMGTLGLVLYFFSYENIRLFGARFWYLLWFVGLIVWAVILVRFIIKDIPVLREKHMRVHAKSKYIQGRKRRSS